MEELKIKLVGTVPLLMHNNQGANPLSPYAQAQKALTSKKKKTDQDYMEIARLEWEGGLYMKNGVVVIPAKCLERCFMEGAKKSKNGKLYQSGAMVDDDFCELSYSGQKIKIQVNGTNPLPNPELDKFYKDHCHQDMVRVNMNQVLRTRPIFEDWSLVVTVLYDSAQIDDRTMLKIMEDAGHVIGLCEQRPRLGRFAVEV